jgi:hypothetical protein
MPIGVDTSTMSDGRSARLLGRLRLLAWGALAAVVAAILVGVVVAPFTLGGVGDVVPTATDRTAFLALVGATVAGTLALVAAQVASG